MVDCKMSSVNTSIVLKVYEYIWFNNFCYKGKDSSLTVM